MATRGVENIEAGKMDRVLEDFDLAKLLAEVEAVVPPLMSRNGNQFLLQVEGVPGSMHSDQTKLRQALLNLLSNAAKFTEQGTITLSVQRELREGQDWLRFAVSDTGIGMSAEQVGKLFSAFSQAEAGTSARYGGTGLGLVLSREVCRLLGGEITVECEPGVGSTFTIALSAAVLEPA